MIINSDLVLINSSIEFLGDLKEVKGSLNLNSCKNLKDLFTYDSFGEFVF